MRARLLLRPLPLVVLALLIGSLIGPVTAGAAGTFNVTTTADTDDGACSPGNCSLRDAVTAADAVQGSSVINVPAGTYALTTPPENGDAAELEISSQVTIKGAASAGVNAAGADGTIIDGSHLGTVFHVQAGGSLTLEDLTIENGQGGMAGGVYAEADLTTSGVTIRDSTAGEGGSGGIYTSAKLTMDNTVVRGNSATGDHVVGGVYAEILPSAQSLPAAEVIDFVNISNSLFDGNAAHDASFGAGGLELNLGTTHQVTIGNTTFSNNTADGEYAAGAFLSLHGGDVHINDSQFLDNSATGEFTAGAAHPYAYLFLDNDLVSGNTGGYVGAGGILADSRTQVTNTTINNNTAGDDGGGGLVVNDVVNLTDSLVTNNSAGADAAGGIYANAYLDVANTTVTGNSAGDGSAGGVYNNSEMYSRFTTIAGNTGGLAGGIYNYGHRFSNGIETTATPAIRSCLPTRPTTAGSRSPSPTRGTTWTATAPAA